MDFPHCVLHANFAVRPAQEFKLVAIVAALGYTCNNALVMAGWLQYPSETLFAGMAPFWLLAVWVNFAMTLNVSLPWLKGRWILTAALGFVGGPLAYLAGANLNAVVISGPTSFFVLAIGWGVLMPLLTALATRFNGFETIDGFRPLVSKRPNHV